MATPPPLSQYRIPALPSTFYYIPNFLSPPTQTSLLHKIPPNRWTVLTHRRLQSHPSPLLKSNTLLAAPLPPWLTDPILPRFSALDVFATTPHGAPNHCLVNEYRAGEGIMPHEDGPAYAPVVATVSLGGAVVLELFDRRAGDEVAGEVVRRDTGIYSPAPEESAAREEERRRRAGRNGDRDGDVMETAASGTSTENTTPDPSTDEDSEHHTADPLPTTSTPSPLHRILLEPGSLFITTESAYTSLLHGIPAIPVDTSLSSSTIANWAQLGDPAAYADGTNERRTRVSLTYRDVLKVSYAGRRILGMGGGR